MSITIKGQAGADFNATVRPIGEVAANGRLAFNSLSADVLSFAVTPELLTAGDLDLPQEGQEISLFIDGDREFLGTVRTVSAQGRAGSLSVSVEVLGTWFFLENTALSDLVDGGLERPQFRCEKGDLRGHIIRLLNRAITLGVPMGIGTIDECYDVPTITLRDGSLGYGLAELMRQVPDAIGWFDYSGSGLPEFNLTRRKPAAGRRTINLAADVVTEVSLKAEYDLVVKQVSVPYASRTDGVNTLLSQDSSGGALGALQTVALSGPELLDFEPTEIDVDASGGGENYRVTSELFHNTGTSSRTGAVSRVVVSDFELFWPFHRGWKAKYTGMPNLPFFSWNGSRNNQSPWTDKPFQEGVSLVVTDDDGTVLSGQPTRRWAVVEDGNPLPSWLWETLNAKRYRVAGHFYTHIQPFAGAFPDWLNALRAEGDVNGFITRVGGPDNNEQWLTFDAQFDVVLIDQDLNDVEFLRSEVDITVSAYEFEDPPANYAENLKDAQSWLPHTGTVTLGEDFGPLDRYSGSTLNVTGGLPKWAAMGALVEGEEFDLETGLHVVRVGLPGRFSRSVAATRIDRRPNDNIVKI